MDAANRIAKPGPDAPDDAIIRWLQQEYDAPFEGWDFAYLSGRRLKIGKEPWDYVEVVIDHLVGRDSLLDLATGGGEILSNVLSRSRFKGRVSATEGFAPNVALARKLLAPFGVEVEAVNDDNPLPFMADSFDAITNRHGGDNHPAKLARLLKAGGVYITQQIGAGTNQELEALVGCPRTVFDTSGTGTEGFKEAGFEIVRVEQAQYKTQYIDVGALAYYLKAIPWEAVGFSVSACADALLDLHRDVESGNRTIDLSFHLNLLVARNG